MSSEETLNFNGALPIKGFPLEYPTLVTMKIPKILRVAARRELFFRTLKKRYTDRESVVPAATTNDRARRCPISAVLVGDWFPVELVSPASFKQVTFSLRI